MKAILTSIAAVLVTSACAAADQHDEEVSQSPEGVESCVYLRSVDRVEILDEQHILFFMRDRWIYNNHLSRQCPGLRRDDTIMYRTTLNQLCSIDMFTVLDNIVGAFTPSVTCTFGRFYPVSQDELDALKARQRQ